MEIARDLRSSAPSSASLDPARVLVHHHESFTCNQLRFNLIDDSKNESQLRHEQSNCDPKDLIRVKVL